MGLDLSGGIRVGNDGGALLLPIGRAEHRVALAVLQHHVFHRLIGDLLDLLVQRSGQQVVVARVHHHHAVAGDDEREVVIVPGVLVGGRRGGADGRPDAVGHLLRPPVEHGLRRPVLVCDGQPGIAPGGEALGVVNDLRVAHVGQGCRGQGTALVGAAVDDDRGIAVWH